MNMCFCDYFEHKRSCQYMFDILNIENTGRTALLKSTKITGAKRQQGTIDRATIRI